MQMEGCAGAPWLLDSVPVPSAGRGLWVYPLQINLYYILFWDSVEIFHIAIWVGRCKEFSGKILVSRWNLNKNLKQEQYENHANMWITKCWVLRSLLVCAQHSKPLSMPGAKQGLRSRDDRRDLICCCTNLGFGFPLEDFMQRNSTTWLIFS